MNTNNWLKYLMSKILHIILFACVLSLTACQTSTRSNINKQDNFLFFQLMPVPEILQNNIWLDKFTLSFNNSNNELIQQNMLLQTELTEDAISIAAMSFDGAPLAQAQWNVKTQQLLSETTIAQNFNPKRVMQDMQSVNWPLTMLKTSLFDGYSVEDKISSEGKIRLFYFNKKLIIRIQKKANKINFEQIEQGYQISIERLEDNQLTREF